MSAQKIPALAQVMTPFPWHIEARASLRAAQRMMEEHNFHHLPVMENGDINSIISDRDIKRASIPGDDHYLDELEVGDLCPVRVYIADVSDPLDKILEVMADTHIGAVLVTREGELAGIFTENDACRLFMQFLRDSITPTPDDIVA